MRTSSPWAPQGVLSYTLCSGRAEPVQLGLPHQPVQLPVRRVLLTPPLCPALLAVRLPDSYKIMKTSFRGHGVRVLDAARG